MKKFAKMSLVAAVAVAGMTSASAASLEEAIKGVDVSGQFRYRMQEISNGDSGTDVEVEVTAKVPVNDMVTAVFKIDNAGDDSDTAIDKDTIAVEDYYFQYVNGAVTATFGQQNIPGRLTDGGQGNGLVALYNAGAFTVGAAAYDNVTINSVTYDDMLSSVIAMGNIGPVSLLAQYADLEDVLDAYNLKADVNIEGIKAGLEFTKTEYDTDTTQERETFKAYVAGSIDIVSATLAYAETGKTNSGSIAEETEAASELLLWQAGSAGNADMEAFVIDASIQATDKISVRGAYLDGEVTTANTDVTETLFQVSYKMSSNLNTYVRYSNYELGTNEDVERGRIEVTYSF